MTAWPINQPGDVTVLDVPTDILCSYHYFHAIDMAKIQEWGTRIIGDSGAFSAMSGGSPVDREEFHAWADRWRDALFWTAALDVIGDAEASYQNWIAARRDGLELVPTLHYGESTAALDRFAEEGATLIGLGGMVPYSSEKDRLMRWCLQMHRHARDHHPHVRFHGWGISHPFLVDNLPWWSTDSSGFSSCFRFGTLRLWDPRKGRFFGVDLNGRDLAKHARLLRETYNVDWKLISRSTSENRRPLGRVALRSVQLYASWLQKRQRVTAPALLEGKLTGPLQVGAMGESTGAPGAVIHPEGRLISKIAEGAGHQAGPQAVAAMEAPEMQPVKALNPSSGTPGRVSGPLNAAAVPINNVTQYCLGVTRSEDIPRSGPLAVAAMIPSAQGQAITPDGLPIGKQIGETNA